MTNKEIASQVGVSPAALSLIINHKPGVSEATRSRVLNELKELVYEHLIKSSAAAEPSNNLCFIIYKRHGEILDLHPFFLLLMENIESRARSYGYNILLSTIDKRRPVEPQIERINELNSQGAIIFATEMFDEDMDAFSAIQIPFVALDNDFTRLSCNSVSINNQMGTYQAIDYLVRNGHRNIGYLKSQTRISSFRERHSGYENALKHFSLAFLPEHIWTVHYTEEGSYRDIRKILDSPSLTLPDAFVCDDDTTAVGFIRACSEKGIRIPEDISIIGFNDRPTCEVTSPPLTSVNVSKRAFAVEAVDELMRLIQDADRQAAENGPEKRWESRSRKIRIGTKLIVRESVGRKSAERQSAKRQ